MTKATPTQTKATPPPTKPALGKKNLSNFTPTTLDGERVTVPDLNKLLGNSLYFSARDISALEKAKAIYKEEDFEVDDALIEAIRGTEKSIAFWLIAQLVEFLQPPKPDAK